MVTSRLVLRRIIGVTALLTLIWTATVVAAGLAGWGRINVEGTGSASFMIAAREAANGHRGNMALILIEDGKVAQTHMQSIGQPVTKDTLFQMASVSKWVAAWGVMTLVEAGKLDLDAPVSRYLTRWKLPPSEHDNDKVTVRRLLSHTAGLTDDLGYCGFAPGTPVESLEASLTIAADACPLRTGKVEVGDAPGGWRYSGGGFTLLQLLIEERSGEPFADYMERAVFVPLGMFGSTYRTGAAGSTGIATFYDSDGSVAPHNHYTAAAAASLYASAADLAQFAQAHWMGPNGEPAGRGVISPETLSSMLRPQSSILGSGHWGLGMRLYAPSTGGGNIFGHDGGNVPAVNTTLRIDPATGDAIISLATGGNGIAPRLGSDWVALRRAAITPIIVHGEIQRGLFWILGGIALIVIGGGIAIWRTARRGRAA